MQRIPRLALLAVFGLGPACNQADPPGLDGSDSGTVVPLGEGELGSYFPLVDGGQWVYEIREDGQLGEPEIVDARAVEFAGAPAMLFVDNPKPDGDFTESTIVRRGSSAERVHKEVVTPAGVRTIVDYDPGFTRFDDAWTEPGGKGERRYERTELSPMDVDPVPDVETRGHVFTVLSVDEEVTVPAGTFSCVAVERLRTTGASAGERVLLWYAAGVGKVREERPATGRTEELAELSIPGGAELP
ncbi:MAG: hypothetical protein AB1Z98_11395 [Nannocystaceae bacterium]